MAFPSWIFIQQCMLICVEEQLGEIAGGHEGGHPAVMEIDDDSLYASQEHVRGIYLPPDGRLQDLLLFRVDDDLRRTEIIDDPAHLRITGGYLFGSLTDACTGNLAI